MAEERDGQDFEAIPMIFRKGKFRTSEKVSAKLDERAAADFVVALDGSGDFDNIQSAVNALTTTRGGSIFVKEGTYELTSTISIDKNNVSIIGTGEGTKIKRKSDAAFDLITVGGGVTTRTNIILSKISIDDLAGASASKGIVIQKCARVYVQDCYLNNVHDDPIGTDANCSLVWITNNYLSGSADVTLRGTNLFFENNYLYAGGLEIYCTSSKIKRNVLNGANLNESIHIRAGGNYNALEGNETPASSDDNIWFFANANYNTCIGNHVKDVGGITDAGTGNVIAHNYTAV